MPGSFGLRNSEFAKPNVPHPASRLNVHFADAGRPVVRSGCFSADVSGGAAGGSCAAAGPGPIATASSMRSGKTDRLGVHFMAAILSALRTRSGTRVGRQRRAPRRRNATDTDAIVTLCAPWPVLACW